MPVIVSSYNSNKRNCIYGSLPKCRAIQVNQVLLPLALIQLCQNRVNHFTRSQNGIEITSIEHFYDPNTNDSIYDYVLIYLIRQNKKLQVEVDNHVCGIFPLCTWHSLLGKEGFNSIQEVDFHSQDFPDENYTVLVAFKP